jgi:hypothetical protein
MVVRALHEAPYAGSEECRGCSRGPESGFIVRGAMGPSLPGGFCSIWVQTEIARCGSRRSNLPR